MIFEEIKRSRTANRVRPKRVGYWKASYIKITFFTFVVNRSFCHFLSSFAKTQAELCFKTAKIPFCGI